MSSFNDKDIFGNESLPPELCLKLAVDFLCERANRLNMKLPANLLGAASEAIMSEFCRDLGLELDALKEMQKTSPGEVVPFGKH